MHTSLFDDDIIHNLIKEFMTLSLFQGQSHLSKYKSKKVFKMLQMPHRGGVQPNN